MLDPHFESFLRRTGDLNEDDIQLTLKQYTSHFITYEITPGIYTIKDLQETNLLLGDHEGTLKIESDDITMKTKLVFNPFWWNFRCVKI